MLLTYISIFIKGQGRLRARVKAFSPGRHRPVKLAEASILDSGLACGHLELFGNKSGRGHRQGLWPK